jgi:hypothetical protein
MLVASYDTFPSTTAVDYFSEPDHAEKVDLILFQATFPEER